jgi:hypothetical protein
MTPADLKKWPTNIYSQIAIALSSDLCRSVAGCVSQGSPTWRRSWPCVLLESRLERHNAAVLRSQHLEAASLGSSRYSKARCVQSTPGRARRMCQIFSRCLHCRDDVKLGAERPSGDHYQGERRGVCQEGRGLPLLATLRRPQQRVRSLVSLLLWGGVVCVTCAAIASRAAAMTRLRELGVCGWA